MENIDPKLQDAACKGDVNFLKKVVASSPPYNDNYFLGLTKHWRSNIFNMAAFQGKLDFIKEALQILPTHILQQLLSNPNHLYGYNPFHEASKMGYLEILRVMLGFYKSYKGPPLMGNDLNNPLNKPWLGLSNSQARDDGNRAKQTPLHFAIVHGYEECAMELLSIMEIDFVCGVLEVDEDGNSPLFLAVRKGFNRVAEIILNAPNGCSYSVCGQGGSTALHVATRYSSGNVIKLMLKKHLDCLDIVDNEGFNVVRKWAEEGSINQLELLLEEGDFLLDARSKIFSDLICMNNVVDSEISPLHLAMMIPNIEFMKSLFNFYKQQERKEKDISLDCPNTPPWCVQLNNGDTPLLLAISSKLEGHALYLIEIDSKMCEIRNNKGESPLLVAVGKGCELVIEKILNLYPNPYYNMLRRNDGLTLLHLLKFCSEKIVKRLLGKFWWMINVRDDRGRNPLDEVKEDTPWLANLLMNPSLVPKEPFDWITACKRKETIALQEFVHNCNDLEEICRKEMDTPLHHIKFETYFEYLNFLKIPAIKELKNAINKEGATPLHLALKRKDIHLAKALLIDTEIERNIVDDTGYTALGLLVELCEEDDDWAKMCKQIKVNPYLKTVYIQSRTNLNEMRNTLSVVAALLATITFAAAFTLPGGLNSNNGYAMLAKKVPFLVFLLADTYAMCTSMFVLFCLVWSMISDRDMSYFLVDRSVLILMQSLYGTLLAFMTGIYTVMANESLWAAIVVLVLCSLIGISVNRTILREIITKLVPATAAKLSRKSKKKDNSFESLEEGL